MPDTRPVRAAECWAKELDAWVIPARILDAAPESPWGFPPELFRFTGASGAATPSSRRALEVLPQGGAVLDVGVGAGAGSLPLASRAGSITGVDESMDMLTAFRAAARRHGIEHRTVLGTWPEVAPRAGTADVVVAHHVIYNVRDLASFCLALTGAARRRVVVESTERHPAEGLNDLWKHFHDIERPKGPTVGDAMAVLTEAGIEPEIERWTRPGRAADAPRSDVVAFVRRRLCLTEDRDAEIDQLLGNRSVLSSRAVATIWWAA